jgi:hypothetical protein
MSAMDDLIAEIERLKKRIADLETQDLPFGALTDYSATSTVTGWSSFTAKQIFYRTTGKVVFVKYRIIGTSDLTTATFTVPYNMAASIDDLLLPVVVRDNGTTQTAPGRLVLSASGNQVVFGKALNANGGFTASGEKYVIGEFWYWSA